MLLGSLRLGSTSANGVVMLPELVPSDTKPFEICMVVYQHLDR